MNVDIKTISLIAQKEILFSLRNKWFLIYTIIFAILSLGLSLIGLSGLENYGVSGFGRTTASLINMIILFVPLMGLTLGAMSIAYERERGTLLYILAQPVSYLEVIMGKFFGLGVSILVSLVLGFGLSGLIIGVKGGTADLQGYMLFIMLTFLLANVNLAIGMFISGYFRKYDTALGVSIFVWLFFVIFSDLGVIGTSFLVNLNINQVFLLTIFNPIQVFKLSAIFSLRDNLEILGPVGNYVVRNFGSNLQFFLVGILLTLTVIFMYFTQRLFKRRGAV
ncbi:MAG TPA: ABC transporter permease subunit [Ignavibacteriaceae bacterium]|jgi:Cu-processing system permease protein|nr:ABC transporter permease subunit [Ignavibacteriaceae bacterium]